MNKWNEDGEIAHFDEIYEPLVEALEFAYDLNRKNEDRSIPWNGLDIGERDKGCSPSPDVRFKKEYLDCAMEKHDESAYHAILQIAVQLGIEQGRRLGIRDYMSELSPELITDIHKHFKEREELKQKVREVGFDTDFELLNILDI